MNVCCKRLKILYAMAGVTGFEPIPQDLESCMLPLNTIPLSVMSLIYTVFSGLQANSRNFLIFLIGSLPFKTKTRFFLALDQLRQAFAGYEIRTRVIFQMRMICCPRLIEKIKAPWSFFSRTPHRLASPFGLLWDSNPRTRRPSVSRGF